MFATTEPSDEIRPEQRPAKSLSRYLNDQLAHETLAFELAARASAKHGRSRLGNFLLLLSWALEEDRDSLASLMSQLGVRRTGARIFFARIAQSVRRLSIGGPSPARTLAELTELDLQINRKLEMWNVLRNSGGDRASGFDFDAAIDRAEGQAHAIEQRRLAAVDAASKRGRSAAAPAKLTTVANH